MRIGGALFLIAVGAILKWAVHKHVSGINLHVVGLILLIIGIVGLLFEIGLMISQRRTNGSSLRIRVTIGANSRPNSTVDASALSRM